jgi:hypothetical protein
VFTFGYNANWRGLDTTLSILDFAKDLLVQMRGYGDHEADIERPIVKVSTNIDSVGGRKLILIQSNAGADYLYCPFNGRASRQKGMCTLTLLPTLSANLIQAYILGQYDEH